jgi:hypothetical protein
MSMARTELKMTDLEFQIAQIKTDVGVTEQAYKYLIKIAKEWGVDVTNIAWLGNKPYPMQGALYQMLQKKCEKEGLIVKSIMTKFIVRAEPTSKRAGFECDIVLFDSRAFDELMKKNSIEKMPVESIREMREMLTHKFHEDGWASPESVRMTTLHNADYLNHMGATRAIDRTLRIIVRCPFTAASELPDGTPGELGFGFSDPQSDVPTAKPGQPAPEPEAKPEEKKEAPAAAPTAKPISQKPIHKIETTKPAEEKKPEIKAEAAVTVPKKEAKLSEKQIDLALIQWSAYCTENCKGIDKKQIDDKRVRLLKALFAKEKVADLTVEQLGEWVGMMTKKEIEISLDNAPPPAAPVEKPEIKT